MNKKTHNKYFKEKKTRNRPKKIQLSHIRKGIQLSQPCTPRLSHKRKGIQLSQPCAPRFVSSSTGED